MSIPTTLQLNETWQSLGVAGEKVQLQNAGNTSVEYVVNQSSKPLANDQGWELHAFEAPSLPQSAPVWVKADFGGVVRYLVE